MLIFIDDAKGFLNFASFSQMHGTMGHALIWQDILMETESQQIDITNYHGEEV